MNGSKSSRIHTGTGPTISTMNPSGSDTSDTDEEEQKHLLEVGIEAAERGDTASLELILDDFK